MKNIFLNKKKNTQKQVECVTQEKLGRMNLPTYMQAVKTKDCDVLGELRKF